MPKSAEPRIYQIKVTLKFVRPAIWRRLLVPSAIPLCELHQVLQTAIGWDDAHLHQFVTPGGDYYAVPEVESDFDVMDEMLFRLDQLLRREKDWIGYEYDFGDGWEHKVVLEKILPPSAGPAVASCIAGKRACPPEDCGGVGGYARLLEAIQDPAHPEHEEMVEWIGDGFDTEKFDIDRINKILAEQLAPSPTR